MPDLKLTVNGIEATVLADPSTSLLSVLRKHFHLTGAKYACGEGQCGACTVMVGGEAVRSCVFPIHNVGQKYVETIEGLANSAHLHPIQQAFLDASAFQCGFCTPGMIMASVALLDRNPAPSVEEIRAGLAGNVCRCGTYSRIVKAVQSAAKAGRNA
ncbi:MAG TPA: (2Fe-2S)-binding protein [Bryobacteraceae bacterium]|jgi:aerobic-type carbon monoxide dehydrogenase small subunit (CoxS/CutS family)|nr:(2Fe-2S)-binding protein [Bryobacteraceae bacterium]